MYLFDMERVGGVRCGNIGVLAQAGIVARGTHIYGSGLRSGTNYEILLLKKAKYMIK